MRARPGSPTRRATSATRNCPVPCLWWKTGRTAWSKWTTPCGRRSPSFSGTIPALLNGTIRIDVVVYYPPMSQQGDQTVGYVQGWRAHDMTASGLFGHGLSQSTRATRSRPCSTSATRTASIRKPCRAIPLPCGSRLAQNYRTGPLPHVPKTERAPPKRSLFKGLSADPGSAVRKGTLPEGLLKVRPENRCRSGWPGLWQSCRWRQPGPERPCPARCPCRS